jgi:FMN phosphatase YigB (HAD superfamily)
LGLAEGSGVKFILTDLDGVVRHFPVERDARIEKQYGLPEGSLHAAAFGKELLSKAITGVISDEAWREEITLAISKFVSPEVAALAVREWGDFPGEVDHTYLKHLETVFPNIPVAVLTNGTSRLNRDLAALGIQDRFFKVFNSAEIGFFKPDPRLFQHVIESLNCKPEEIFFIDDSFSHVQGALALGMKVHHYHSFEGFRNLR